jgi:uncharacterized membrane protein
MLYYAGKKSLWSDDLWTISFVGKGQSLEQMASNITIEAKANPPLFLIFAALWLRIAPYGTVSLKLFSIIFSALGMFMCGVAARKIKGERAAIFATLFASVSWFLIGYGAHTFRCYGLLFFLVSSTICVYSIRLLAPSKKHLIEYSIMLLLLCFTHYFGLMLAAALFVCDVVLVSRKRLRWQDMLPYPILGVLFGVYFIPIFITRIVANNAKFWARMPNLEMLINLWNELTGSSIVSTMFIVGAVVSIAVIFSPQIRNYLNTHRDSAIICVVQAFSVLFVLVAVFVYSRFVNPTGSLFVNRYFVSILPAVFVVAAIGLDYVFAVFTKNLPKNVAQMAFGVVVCVMAFSLGSGALTKVIGHTKSAWGMWEPYEQVANWIYSQESSHHPDALVTMTGGGLLGQSYYITHDGRRPPLNLGSLTLDNYEQYNIVYRFDGHDQMNQASLDILDEYYYLVEEHKIVSGAQNRVVYVYARNDL